MCTLIKVKLGANGNTCEVLWSDQHVSEFHAKWLRFSCECERCSVALYPGDFKHDIYDFPAKLAIAEATILDDGSSLRLRYIGEIKQEHVTIHFADWLRSKCYCDHCLDEKLEEHDVIKKHITTRQQRVLPKMDYKSLEESGNCEVFEWINHIMEAGFCLITNVPEEDGMVVKMAEKITYVDRTSYGEMFQVTNRMSENIGYTNRKLMLHQDLQQYEAAPGVQMMHALRFDPCVEGGESTLVDMFEAVEILRRESPEHFKTLTEVPAFYETIDMKSDTQKFFVHQKAHIHLDYYGKVVEVNWNPPTSLQVPLQVRGKDVDRYYEAYRAFVEITRRESLQFRFRMKTGDMMSSNNRRMLHGREAFQENGGKRQLQGCYMKLDEVKSKYMVLAHMLNIDVVSPKVGNKCSW